MNLKIMLGKEEDTTAHTEYDSIYMRFKGRQDQSMVVVIRIVVDTHWKGAGVNFLV